MPPSRSHTSKITVSPSSLSILQTGSTGALVATVTEKSFAGSFTIANTCAGKATSSPATKGNGPSLKVTITGVKVGSCDFTFSDGTNKASLPVTVTTTTLNLSGSLPSAKTADVKIGNTSTSVAMPACATSKGCSLAVAAPIGKDAFSVVVSDASKKTLATSQAQSSTIKSGVANVVTLTFLKTVASLSWGTIPSGASGTPFASGGKAVTLTAKDADGNAIDGSYASPITLADSDSSGATGFTINGASGSALKASTDALDLTYSGLAISPATLTASSTGVNAVKATFSPTVAAIVFTPGSGAISPPEVDLYSIVSGAYGSGFKAQFTATQSGWTNSPFSQAFTYSFAAVKNQTNDCPTSTVPAYLMIAPAKSGDAGTAFAISASTQIQGAAYPGNYAGECTMTIAGGGGQTLQVLLTFTTSGIGINARHAHGHR
ncbi:MAG: hypothetical protein JO199_09090 [Candidatus Eremiobacteraeota bacterium]|nr:hypothetical protein [Candidatus Eremiobacteraeota bacterium]